MKAFIVAILIFWNWAACADDIQLPASTHCLETNVPTGQGLFDAYFELEPIGDIYIAHLTISQNGRILKQVRQAVWIWHTENLDVFEPAGEVFIGNIEQTRPWMGARLSILRVLTSGRARYIVQLDAPGQQKTIGFSTVNCK